MMKKMVRLNFGKSKVVKFSGAYYVNFYVEKSLFVLIDEEKYYKIKKGKLRSLGMKNFGVKRGKTGPYGNIPLKKDYNWNIIRPELFFYAA